jgi:hypothetical protein
VLWPAWFAGADFVLAILALGLAFMVGSFIARNSDVWLHLAAGQRLLSGQYQPGSDPFSYSAADRTWVNHSLLFDVGVYLLYGGDGVVLVVLKAVAVALTFGLLMGIRRTGFPLWHWAIVAGVAIVAAAPRLVLSPLVGSVLLLALTLFLLYRFPQRPRSWRFPIAIGITFWVWAQVDGWFFVGPLTLVLVLVGELVQSQFRKSETAADTSPEPLGTLPDVPTLAKALAVGVLACMLNPHHVRIWQLPFELIGGHGAVEDYRFRQQLLLTPLDKLYRENPSLGYCVNGLAYAVLFVGGGVILGLGVGRIRFAHILLWIGFALLSLTSIYAIPLFTVVAVPLLSAQLNAFSSRAVLKNWGDPLTKFLFLGSAAGRVLSLVAFIAVCILAWPGWMHPDFLNPALSRRVDWGIEPDAGLVQAAKQIQSWRESGQLAPEVRGVILSTDLANYCAWFAPLEKVYLNSNYRHHLPELPDFVAMRSGLSLFKRDETQESGEVSRLLEKTGKLLEKNHAEYLAFATTQGESPLSRYIASITAVDLWVDATHWSPWYWDGRAAITGWRPKVDATPPAFTAMRFDPLELAFGPNVARLPAESVQPIPPEEGWEGEFLHGVGICPPGVDEAWGWQAYKESILRQHNVIEDISSLLSYFTPAPSNFSPHRLTMLVTLRLSGNHRRPPPETILAIPFLTLRAARRAIAADPNHPDGYYALYLALSDLDLPIPDSERKIGQLNALRQCLARLPSPERFHRNVYRASPFTITRILASYYFGQPKQEGWPPTALPVDSPAFRILGDSTLCDGVVGVAEEGRRLFAIRWRERSQVRNLIGAPSLRAVDLARDMILLASKYAEKELYPENSPEGAGTADALKALKSVGKTIDEEFVRKNAQYDREKSAGGQTKLRDQVRSALRANLVGEALRLLTDKSTDLPKEYGSDIAEIVLVRIALEMLTGRLEDAAADLEFAPSVLESAPAPPNIGRDVFPQIQALRRAQLQIMNNQKLFFEGNYQAAGDMLQSNAPAQFGKDPPLLPKESDFKLPPAFVTLGFERVMQGYQFIPILPVAYVSRMALLGDLLQPYIQRQQKLYSVHANANEFFYQRGFLSLLEGDIPAARKRFEQSRQPGVPEWGVLEQRNQNAERYLRLIEAAEKKTGK